MPQLSASHDPRPQVHEHDTLSDFLIILLRRLLPSRPDFKLLLMSATINVDLFSSYFDGAPSLHIPGFAYPVQRLFLDDVHALMGLAAPAMPSAKADGAGRPVVGEERKVDLPLIVWLLRELCGHEGAAFRQRVAAVPSAVPSEEADGPTLTDDAGADSGRSDEAQRADRPPEEANRAGRPPEEADGGVPDSWDVDDGDGAPDVGRSWDDVEQSSADVGDDGKEWEEDGMVEGWDREGGAETDDTDADAVRARTRTRTHNRTRACACQSARMHARTHAHTQHAA